MDVITISFRKMWFYKKRKCVVPFEIKEASYVVVSLLLTVNGIQKNTNVYGRNKNIILGRHSLCARF